MSALFVVPPAFAKRKAAASLLEEARRYTAIEIR
jgi:hypothetical protein